MADKVNDWFLMVMMALLAIVSLAGSEEVGKVIANHSESMTPRESVQSQPVQRNLEHR